MKITDMKVTPIAFTDPPLLNAAGLHAPYALRIILEIETDAHVTGIGEIAGGSSVLQGLEEARKVVVGMDPFERNKIRLAIDKTFKDLTDSMNVGYTKKNAARRIYSAINIALVDLIGKAIDRPACDVIGGRVRDRISFSAYLFYKYEGAGGKWGFGHNPQATGWDKAKEMEALTPEAVVEEARAMIAEYGFKSIKLKGGVLPPQVECDTIKALAKAFPGYPLRIDPNAVWTYETSVKYAPLLKPYLEYYEDPCKSQEAMARLGTVCDIPRATNMCTTSFDEIPGDIRLGASDIILADPHYWGGMDATIELGRICSVFGRGLSMHSNSHLGISMMAMAHVGVAVPEITYAMDTHYPWQCEDVIEGSRVKFDDGAIVVGNEPGLGVELDHAKLEALHQNFLKCGIRDRNDEVEMQKKVPGWTVAKHVF